MIEGLIFLGATVTSTALIVFSMATVVAKTHKKYIELSKEQAFYTMIENLIKEGTVIRKEKTGTVIIKQKNSPIKIYICRSNIGVEVSIRHPFLSNLLKIYKTKDSTVEFFGFHEPIKQHAQLCEAGYEKIYDECFEIYKQAFGSLSSHFQRIEKQLENTKVIGKEHHVETITSGNIRLQYAKSNNIITYQLVENEFVLWEYKITTYGEIKKERHFWNKYSEEKIQLLQEEVERIKSIIHKKNKQQTPHVIQKMYELKERSKGNEREAEIQKEIDSLQTVFLSLSKQKQQEKEEEILSLLHIIEEKEKIHLDI